MAIICSCPHSAICTQKQEIIKANADKLGFPWTALVGYCKLQTKYSWGEGMAEQNCNPTKQGQYHRKCMNHLYTDTLLGMPKDRRYYNKSHWPLDLLLKFPDLFGKNSIPTTITVESEEERESHLV